MTAAATGPSRIAPGAGHAHLHLHAVAMEDVLRERATRLNRPATARSRNGIDDDDGAHLWRQAPEHARRE